MKDAQLERAYELSNGGAEYAYCRRLIKKEKAYVSEKGFLFCNVECSKALDNDMIKGWED